MAEFLSIEVTGNQELLRELAQALKRLERPAELMRALGARLEANIQDRFDAKRDPDGNRWAELAQSTRKRYDKLDTVKSGKYRGQVRRSGTLLERSGDMRKSLNPSNYGDDWVEVGMSRLTDDEEWSIPLLHETGTRRMPRRGIFFSDPDSGTLGADDDAALSEEIAAFLDDVFGA